MGANSERPSHSSRDRLPPVSPALVLPGPHARTLLTACVWTYVRNPYELFQKPIDLPGAGDPIITVLPRAESLEEFSFEPKCPDPPSFPSVRVILFSQWMDTSLIRGRLTSLSQVEFANVYSCRDVCLWRYSPPLQ